MVAVLGEILNVFLGGSFICVKRFLIHWLLTKINQPQQVVVREEEYVSRLISEAVRLNFSQLCCIQFTQMYLFIYFPVVTCSACCAFEYVSNVFYVSLY